MSDQPFKPKGSQVPDEHQNYTELLYVMGGEAAFPIGVFQVIETIHNIAV